MMLLGGLALAIPAAIMTIRLSPYNFQYVRYRLFEADWPDGVVGRVMSLIYQEQLAWPIVATFAAGVLASAGRRDGRVWLTLGWVVTVSAGVIVAIGAAEPARYSIAALPGYALGAASLAAVARTRATRGVVALLLAGLTVSQLSAARNVSPIGGSGYEQAAELVLAQPRAATMLYSASVDTGYFVFFVRKHDAEPRHVVLRSDKVLTTSLMGRVSVEDRIQAPNEIYPLLQTYGTRYVVIEDRPSGSIVLDWLRTELESENFIERRRIPIVTRDTRLQGVDLVVYEYRDAQLPDLDAVVDMRIPLVGEEFRMPLADLINEP
jgi:hypothetical protein